MSEASTHTDHEEALQRLKELVLDYLGLPRPKQSVHIQALQDELLPLFIDLARHAALASSPFPLQIGTLPGEPRNTVDRYLQVATESRPEEIRRLNEILGELGVHALLEAVANSPDVGMVSQLPVDPYDVRLLREAGHRNPSTGVQAFLHVAAKRHQMLAESEAELQKAERAMLQAHRDINVIIHPPDPTQSGPRAAARTVPAPAGPVGVEKPKRLKLFTGLGKLASGLVLLSGNAIVIPTLTMGSMTALPVLGSLAAGIAAVGEGVSHFLREGE